MSKKPPAIARAKATRTEKAQAEAQSILKRSAARTFEDFKRNIKDIRAIYYQPLGNDLRKQVRARLDLLLNALARLARNDPRLAARARHVLPPSLLPKPSKKKQRSS